MTIMTFHNLWLNPRPVRGGWCNPPPWVFLSWTPHRLEDRAEIFHSLWGILCATFGEKNLVGSGQVTKLWRHKRNNLRKISAKSWINATWRGAIDLNGDSWRDWCQYMTGCDPWHCARWGSIVGFPELLNLNLWFIVPKNVSKPLLPHPRGQSPSFDQFEFWPLRRWRPARVMPFYLGALRMLNIATGYSKKHSILFRIERGTRWWRFQIATTHTDAAISVQSQKMSLFAKIWPLTWPN